MVKINVSHTRGDQGSLRAGLPLVPLCSSGVQVIKISLSLPYVFIHHYFLKFIYEEHS